MANTFITLGAYKFTIDAGSPGRTMPEDKIRNTLNGTIYKSLGNWKPRWTYDLQIKYAADSGYGNRAQFIAMLEDRTVAGQSLAFIDEYGVTYGPVMIVSSMYPTALVSGDLDTATSIYKARVVFTDL